MNPDQKGTGMLGSRSFSELTPKEQAAIIKNRDAPDFDYKQMAGENYRRRMA